jgi:hypothetical protein
MRQAILATAMSISIAGIAAPWDARAAEPDYLDDRSNAEAVVKSFYNAVNRREFSRAWSYFGETKPSANFESFVAGFEGTKSVRVVTGEPGVEGAAGSTFFNVPVAIAATGMDDTERVFAGCYTARLVNPQIQEPPFTALHLERGALKPSDLSAEEALPAQCGDGPPPPARDVELEQAKKIFAASHGEECAPRGQDTQPTEPERYVIKSIPSAPTAANLKRGSSASSAPWAPTMKSISIIRPIKSVASGKSISLRPNFRSSIKTATAKEKSRP